MRILTTASETADSCHRRRRALTQSHYHLVVVVSFIVSVRECVAIHILSLVVVTVVKKEEDVVCVGGCG